MPADSRPEMGISGSGAARPASARRLRRSLPAAGSVYCHAVDVTSPRARLRRAADLLDDLYGRPVLAPRYPPVDELVFTVLSQNTADVNTERTFAALKARFHDLSLIHI